MKRDVTGRYDFDGDLTRLCACGHELGHHSAGGKKDCIFYSLSAEERADQPGTDRPDCGCARFRPARTKAPRAVKLKWSVQPPPTGRYRAFQRRGWPEAEANGRVVAWLYAERDYAAGRAESEELTVRVRDWSSPSAPTATLKCRPVGIKAAKALVARFFEARPEWLKII